MKPSSVPPSIEVPSLHARLVLLGGSMFTLLAGASIAPALPAIKAHFIEHPQADLLTKLVLSLTALCIALGAPIAGWAVDRFGRRRLLVASILGTGIGGTAGYFAWSLESLLATRAVLGFSVAITMTAVTALIADYFAGDARRKFLGTQSAAMKIGGICFLLLGGWLAGFGWRQPFLVDLLALLILPGALLAIRDFSKRPAAVASASAGPPGLNPRATPAVAVVCAIAALSQATFYMLPTQLPFLATQQLGWVAREVGAGLALNALVAAVVASQYGRIRGALGLHGCLLVMFGFMAAGHALVAHAMSTVALMVAMMVSGVGVGMVVPNLSAWMLDIVPQGHRGRAVGWLTSALFTGQFVSPLVWQPVIAQGGVRLAFGVAALALAAGAVTTLAVMWSTRQRAGRETPTPTTIT